MTKLSDYFVPRYNSQNIPVWYQHRMGWHRPATDRDWHDAFMRLVYYATLRLIENEGRLESWQDPVAT